MSQPKPQPKSQTKPQLKVQPLTQAEVSQNQSKNRMGCLDMFALFTGSVGLTVDAIALISLLFVTLNVSGNTADVNTEQLPSFAVMIIFCLTLIYSWLALSWYFCRRYFNNLKSSEATRNSNTINKTWGKNALPIVAVTGISIMPIWWLWIFFIYLISNVSDTIDIANTFIGIIIGGTIGLGFVGIFLSAGIILIISVLMPVIYLDMADISMSDVLL